MTFWSSLFPTLHADEEPPKEEEAQAEEEEEEEEPEDVCAFIPYNLSHRVKCHLQPLPDCVRSASRLPRALG
ncbi:hypothetical protein RHS01_00136 [Rhizoctonia solani]|uniref:Uncharacterized protein n=1 Tax=Rhizoctonia solani TaxID=456999 RepID=A0A8H7M8D3_9AGAM|nr:hypothetical protein RHS01_00136 [Rhizoctonia solani]